VNFYRQESAIYEGKSGKMTGKLSKLKKKNSFLIEEKKARQAVEFVETAIQVDEA